MLLWLAPVQRTKSHITWPGSPSPSPHVSAYLRRLIVHRRRISPEFRRAFYTWNKMSIALDTRSTYLDRIDMFCGPLADVTLRLKVPNPFLLSHTWTRWESTEAPDSLFFFSIRNMCFLSLSDHGKCSVDRGLDEECSSWKRCRRSLERSSLKLGGSFVMTLYSLLMDSWVTAYNACLMVLVSHDSWYISKRLQARISQPYLCIPRHES